MGNALSSDSGSRVRQQIVTTASGVLTGEVEIIEGCRRLVVLAAQAEDQLPSSFSVIRGVESETDDHPVGQARLQYSPHTLAAADRSVAAYIEGARPLILEACNDLIVAWRL